MRFEDAGLGSGQGSAKSPKRRRNDARYQIRKETFPTLRDGEGAVARARSEVQCPLVQVGKWRFRYSTRHAIAHNAVRVGAPVSEAPPLAHAVTVGVARSP
ncbi:unnamed protein product [Boreogadus saida]